MMHRVPNTNILKNKNILITGGTGSIGSEIVRSIIPYHPRVIRILSNDENAMFDLQNELGKEGKRFIIGDIRDKECLMRAMEDIDIVYHCAALKHVPLCEYNPDSTVKTNIGGIQNIIAAAFYNNVERVINISTDKAVNPNNTMGATKLLTEKLITDANDGKGSKRTIFASVRFGNVMMSRGSVIPLWEKQMKQGFIEITDPNMTRYMMSIPDAVKLIFKATHLMHGGEIFILKMPVIRLDELADKMIAGRKIEKKIIGLRKGERLHETLMTDEEADIAVEEDDMFIIPWTGEKL